ncbi:MAG: PqqD family protein [Bacteroidales bacterium]|nr:PqqD family protein [Bacteroidales bacterium]MDD2611501.1 PqqD family protein [Bacteroidales bacterium]MDD3907802.1 PqqD family protein [Bacteroidales bacterium]MDD4712477.1 PqqD family protein [Bacteroidales bacterium]MEA4840263.1 PqqD family protein [Bacteroidales bacterium]
MEIRDLNKLKSQFVTRQVGNELVLVPLSNNVSNMKELFTMNETGRFIWENLTEKMTVDKLAEKLMQEFEVDEETAIKDIKLFLEKVSQMKN